MIGMADGTLYSILDFWDDPQLAQYLQIHGYTLYRHVLDGGQPTIYTIPALPFEDISQAKYPYAYHSAHCVTPKSHSLCADDSSVRGTIRSYVPFVNDNGPQGKMVQSNLL